MLFHDKISKRFPLFVGDGPHHMYLVESSPIRPTLYRHTGSNVPNLYAFPIGLGMLLIPVIIWPDRGMFSTFSRSDHKSHL